MLEQGRGKIINMSSQTGKRAWPDWGVYSASKFAVVGITQVMAQELAPTIAVNAICPGTMMSDMARTGFTASLAPGDTLEASFARKAATIPFGRLGHRRRCRRDGRLDRVGRVQLHDGRDLQPHRRRGGLLLGAGRDEHDDEREVASMSERVGFIGLGRMGTPMAANLARAGFPLTVHNRSPGPMAAFAAEHGAATAPDPATLAEPPRTSSSRCSPTTTRSAT